MKPTKSTSRFTRFAKWTASATGHPWTFVFAVLVIVAWATTGPIFGFSAGEPNSRRATCARRSGR